MAVDDLLNESPNTTVENASHASSEDGFEEGVTVAVTHPLWSKERFREKYWYQWERCNAIERFAKVNDTRCYNLHKEIATLNQGTASISVYYSKLKDLWDETESIVPTHGYDCVKTKEFIVHLRKKKVYQLLMGLNDSYSQAPTAGVLGSTPNINTNAYDSTALYSAKPSFNPKFRKNYNVQCEFCKMKGHSKENYYKIIGYPQDYKAKRKGELDLFSGKVREIGRERDGIYFLQKHGAKKLTAVALVAAGIKLRTTDITLWHKRLGHISSVVLRRLFPAKLASITDTINKCTVCPCAKQTRLPFPNNCIKSIDVIDLIHVDVLGPYKYATFDGNKYILTVVDDLT
uniref:GAG-pre-integrase domain-containing protein n=1 Tax=Nicotiana tabacum TaxID=4097 RepID=A0A1S4AQQ0_TOBAC|nr:PREDICTED: uncharacterized protein LOC107800281 [Nicotiana tabacum]